MQENEPVQSCRDTHFHMNSFTKRLVLRLMQIGNLEIAYCSITFFIILSNFLHANWLVFIISKSTDR